MPAALADRRDSLLGCDEEVKLRTPPRRLQGTEARGGANQHSPDLMKEDAGNGGPELKTPPRDKTSREAPPAAHINIGRNGFSAFKSPVPSS